MHFIIMGLGSGISLTPTTDPARGLQQVVKLLLAKPGAFCVILALEVMMAPEDLCTIESLSWGQLTVIKGCLQRYQSTGRGKEASFKRIEG